jgi:hypothetical protein
VKPEQAGNVNGDRESTSAEASSGESKEDREKSFSGRAILQWSLPAEEDVVEPKKVKPDKIVAHPVAIGRLIERSRWRD